MTRTEQKTSKFLDLYDPYFGQTISPDAPFRLQSLVDVPGGTGMRVLIWDRSKDENVVSLPPLPYRRQFTLPEVFRASVKHLRRKPKALGYVDLDTGELRDGQYIIRVKVDCPGFRNVTRSHQFNVRKGYQEPPFSDRRVWCPLPWTTMRLRPMAAVFCCYMKHWVKLHYNFECPEFFDPWGSDAMAAMRQSLVDGDARYCFPNCPELRSEPLPEREFEQLPEGPIRDNAKLAFHEYVEGHTRLESRPVCLSVDLGSACNNGCIFCRIPYSSAKHKLTDNVVQLIASYSPTLSDITFTGGEPLLHFQHIERFERMGLMHEHLRTHISTNGILIADLLEPLGLLTDLNVSVALNTSDRETYKKLHRRDNFDKVVTGVRRLREARQGKPTTIHLQMLLMKTTYREILDFARLAFDLGVDRVAFRPLRVYKATAIDPYEKIMVDSPEYHETNQRLEEVRQLAESRGVEFKFLGWGTMVDEYEEALTKRPTN